MLLKTVGCSIMLFLRSPSAISSNEPNVFQYLISCARLGRGKPWYNKLLIASGNILTVVVEGSIVLLYKYPASQSAVNIASTTISCPFSNNSIVCACSAEYNAFGSNVFKACTRNRYAGGRLSVTSFLYFCNCSSWAITNSCGALFFPSVELDEGFLFRFSSKMASNAFLISICF